MNTGQTNKVPDSIGGLQRFIFQGKLGRTLLSWFLLLSLIPLILVSWISYQNANDSLRNDAEVALITVANLKTRQIDAYFSDIFTDMRAQAQSQTNMHFLEILIKTFKDSGKPVGDFVKGFKWTMIVDEKGKDLKTYRRTFDYHDIFLIDSRGNILYSVTGEEDLGTNLFNGKYSDTKFAAACKKSLETGQPVFSDYQFYAPSGNIASGFIVSVIVKDDGDKIGLIAFQFTIDSVNNIMQAKIALGRTAETYLLGPDLKMRSDSILEEEKTVLKGPVETRQARLWQEQIDKGIDQKDMPHPVFIYDGPHGKPVLGIHRDIYIKGVPFGVIAEIEVEEAFAPARDLQRTDIGLLIATALVVFFVAIVISRRIVRPIRTLSSGAKRVAEGDLDHKIEITSRNEIGELAHSFNNMLGNLRLTNKTNEAQNWLMNGQAKLNEKMRGEPDLAALGANITSFLAEYLNAQIGAVYIADEENQLQMIGSYAYNRWKELSNRYMPGEGLVGQAALEKNYILITNCPEDYISIHSGLGQAVPANILVFPVLLGDKVKGVIELGSFNEFSKSHLVFLGRAADSIAIALNSVVSRTRTTTLLEQTQQQAEKLQAQQEELRQANEELEIHAKALKRSESRLQAQQEELRRTNEELEENARRLEEQKKDTDRKNQELRIAREQIEEKARDLEISSKYKSEFLSNMSHELRSPLNSILLLSRLLADNKDGSLSEDQVESARSIYTSGTELLYLINEVLDLSKVEAGKMELHLENMALQDFSRDMERHFQPLAAEKGLSWNLEIAGGLPGHIRTDRQRAQQVVKNFLSNAFKFTKEGSVTLRISRPAFTPADVTVVLAGTLDPAKTVSFSVIDTGTGIAKEKQKVVFEAFQQADGTTSRKFGGTGLGLSISKELAKLLGGEIRMTSNPGKGSTFTLSLPESNDYQRETGEKDTRSIPSPVKLFTRENEIRIEKQTRKVTDRQKALEAIEDDRKNISPRDKSILIIEDDPEFVKILRNLSRERGFKCLVAGDGETGLHFADYYKPSAIILDIGLPSIDGWAVMARLKENPVTRHIPVHFISVSDRELEALKMGAVDFATKPVSPKILDQVFDKLDKVISKPKKDLLVVEDNPEQAKSIAKFISNGDVRVTITSTAAEAYEKLLSGDFDCVILDIGLPDMSGLELLDKIRNSKDIDYLPIIVYTGRKISKKERKIIDKYAESTIIKGADSHQKLLDETALFLHRVEANLPGEQQKVLRMIHDKEAILADKKILVVDDDMRNVYSLKRVLEEKEVKVLVGKNGKEGLEVLNKNPGINLVLMDIMMPEMDGYEAMEEIRKQDRYKNLPIIALTAKAMRGDRDKCIEAGASDYLAKPVDVDRLYSMLRVWLY
jgi:tubulin-specific chaperone A